MSLYVVKKTSIGKNKKLLILFLLVTGIFFPGCKTIFEPFAIPEHIVFLSRRAENEFIELYRIDMNGENLKRLTHNFGTIYHFTFSPDGSMIAFTARYSHGYEHFHLINIFGEKIADFIAPPGISYSDPHFSPNGSKIIYVSTEANAPLTEIFIMNIDGSNKMNLTKNDRFDVLPEFFPDGSKIIYHSDESGNRYIYAVNADGSNPKCLTPNRELSYFGDFSPDGRQIVFSSRINNQYDIFTMDIDGNNQKNITTSEYNEGCPQYLPDGSGIIITSNKDGDYEIYLVSTDGKFLAQLTDNTSYDSSPHISPDGRTIVFISDRDGNYEVYLMNLDGSGQTNLSHNPGIDKAPKFRPYRVH